MESASTVRTTIVDLPGEIIDGPISSLLDFADCWNLVQTCGSLRDVLLPGALHRLPVAINSPTSKPRHDSSFRSAFGQHADLLPFFRDMSVCYTGHSDEANERLEDWEDLLKRMDLRNFRLYIDAWPNDRGFQVLDRICSIVSTNVNLNTTVLWINLDLNHLDASKIVQQFLRILSNQKHLSKLVFDVIGRIDAVTTEALTTTLHRSCVSLREVCWGLWGANDPLGTVERVNFFLRSCELLQSVKIASKLSAYDNSLVSAIAENDAALVPMRSLEISGSILENQSCFVTNTLARSTSFRHLERLVLSRFYSMPTAALELLSQAIRGLPRLTFFQLNIDTLTESTINDLTDAIGSAPLLETLVLQGAFLKFDLFESVHKALSKSSSITELRINDCHDNRGLDFFLRLIIDTNSIQNRLLALDLTGNSYNLMPDNWALVQDLVRSLKSLEHLEFDFQPQPYDPVRKMLKLMAQLEIEKNRMLKSAWKDRTQKPVFSDKRFKLVARRKDLGVIDTGDARKLRLVRAMDILSRLIHCTSSGLPVSITWRITLDLDWEDKLDTFYDPATTVRWVVMGAFLAVVQAGVKIECNPNFIGLDRQCPLSLDARRIIGKHSSRSQRSSGVLGRREISKYPSIDGSFNNLIHSTWGTPGTVNNRNVPPDYDDDGTTPVGAGRPSARAVSNKLFGRAEDVEGELGANVLAVLWGQNCMGNITMPFKRLLHLYDSETMSRHPINFVTAQDSKAFIDGSMIYGALGPMASLQTIFDLSAAGSDDEMASNLRTGAGGFLEATRNGLLPEASTNSTIMSSGIHSGDSVFLAGDIRANENPGLLSLQTLFVREHNRLAIKFSNQNPDWDDERLYQEARKMVIGFIQKITFVDYSFTVLGSSLTKYEGYSPVIDPRIDTFFMVCAFRYGHSAIPPLLHRVDSNGSDIVEGPLVLRDVLFNPSPVRSYGIDSILRGAVGHRERLVDGLFTNDVRKFFPEPLFDLPAWNIQRGRDLGLPTYNSARAHFGLRLANSFADITNDLTQQKILKSLYGSVDNLDAYVGGLSENRMIGIFQGARVGPLFGAAIKDQYERLRNGDRYYYKNGGMDDENGGLTESIYTANEVEEIDKTTLSNIIKRNTDISDYPNSPFLVPGCVIQAFGGLGTPNEFFGCPAGGSTSSKLLAEKLDSVLGSVPNHATAINASNNASTGEDTIVLFTTSWGIGQKLFHGAVMAFCFGAFYPWGIYSARYSRRVSSWITYHAHGMTIAITDISISALTVLLSSDAMIQLPHAKIGITVFILSLVNVAIGVTVEHRGAKFFRLMTLLAYFHALLGWTTWILGITNCFIGIELITAILPDQEQQQRAAILMKYLLGSLMVLIFLFFVIFGEMPKQTGISINGESGETTSAGWLSAKDQKDIKKTKRRVESLLHDLGRPLPQYGWTEIIRRVKAGDRWIVIDGVVYDIGSYIDAKLHPGGMRIILDVIGSDCTSMFLKTSKTPKLDIHQQSTSGKRTKIQMHMHSRYAYSQLTQMAIGTLADESLEEKSYGLETRFPHLDRRIHQYFGDQASILQPHKVCLVELVSKRLVVSQQTTAPVYIFKFALPGVSAKVNTTQEESGGEQTPFARFFPGDHVILQISKKGETGMVARPYSPIFMEAVGHIEVLVKCIPQGQLTSQLLNLPIGELVGMLGPFPGELQLIHPIDPTGCYKRRVYQLFKVVMFAGGSGLSAMLLLIDYYKQFGHWVEQDNKTGVSILTLCCKNRSENDIIMWDKLNEVYTKYT
ncbi:hypothetical protein BJ742DRAFT_744669 [Cladochytrium replicatum]|nr:hypothetical protein BJ742DRAFT_744669 [Cladochytrium replicatum]